MKSRPDPAADPSSTAAAPGAAARLFRETFAGLDLPSAFALTYTAVVLSVKEYFLLPGTAARSRLPALMPSLPPDFACGLVWAASSVVLFLLLPLVFVRVAGLRLRDVGWSAAGAHRHLVVYGALFVAMIPALAWAAGRPEFTSTYPFVASARRSPEIFWKWEAAYLLQFLALEAFFRGYLLFTLARRIGVLAVPVMTVPYAMIHFHKPFAECLGAIGAGWILGLLALRYRSFFGGVLLHAAVAFTMDYLSARKAGLF